MNFISIIIKTLLLVSFVVLLSHCNNNNHNKFPDGIPDANYRAHVEYFNPKTKTESDYTLYVEVKDKKVTVIHFENGGWLDESHIVSGGELSQEGKTTIHTDKGYEYKVSLGE